MMHRFSYIFWLFCIASGFAHGQTMNVDYPRLHAMPPYYLTYGQGPVSPGSPLAFDRSLANPALGAFLPSLGLLQVNVGAQHMDIPGLQLLAGMKLSPDVFIGFSAFAAQYGESRRYDIASAAYRYGTYESKNGFIAGLNFSGQIIPGLALGTNINTYSEALLQGNVTDVAADFGLTWHEPLPNLTLAAQYRNLGPEVTLGDSTIAPPRVTSIDAALDIQFGDFFLGPQVGVELSDDNDTRLYAGLGFDWNEQVGVQLSSTFTGTLIYFPYAAALRYRYRNISANYTISVTDDNKLVHMAGLAIQLGAPEKPARINVAETNQRYYYGEEKPAPRQTDTLSTRLLPPRNLRLLVAENRVTLEWEAASENAGYIVFARRGERSVFRAITKEELQRTTFVFARPKAKQALYFYVKSVRNGERSDPSRIVSLSPEE
jgi:hypothetical protein